MTSQSFRTTILTILVALLVGGAAAQSQLRILQSEPPRSMDPADQTATYTAAVLYPMYETLVEPTEDGGFAPGLATEWTPNETGDVWTFTIREGVTFHDGTPMTAADVKATFDRILNPENGLAGATRFRTVIETVELVGDNQVEMTLFDPYPPFLTTITGAQAAIVKVDDYDAGTLGRHAHGTGPYKFVEWNTSEHVIMETWDGYWGEKPSVDRLVWTWSPEPAVMSMALQAGEIDIAAPLNPIYAVQLDPLDSVDVIEVDGSPVFWIALNVERGALQDVRVRQALNYATNREGIVTSLLRGYGSPANSPVSPALFGYDADTPYYEYDIEKAKALLAEAGYDNVTVSVAAQEADMNVVEALQGMWAEAGIHLNIDLMEAGVWSDAAFADPAGKDELGVDATYASWSTGGDADGQLRPLYHTESWSPESANLGFYSNARVDELIDFAGSTTDEAARLAAYSEAQRIIADEAAHVLLYYPKSLSAKLANVDGIWVRPSGQLMIRWPEIN